jgi:hypothetical protein
MVEEILYGLHISARNSSTQASEEKHETSLLSIHTVSYLAKKEKRVQVS